MRYISALKNYGYRVIYSLSDCNGWGASNKVATDLTLHAIGEVFVQIIEAHIQEHVNRSVGNLV